MAASIPEFLQFPFFSNHSIVLDDPFLLLNFFLANNIGMWWQGRIRDLFFIVPSDLREAREIFYFCTPCKLLAPLYILHTSLKK